MIDAFVRSFDAAREDLRALLTASPPEDIDGLVRAVIARLTWDDEEQVQDGAIAHLPGDDYQGVEAWIFRVKDTVFGAALWYGSCSGCDAFQSAREEPDPAKRAAQMMIIALNFVQNIREVGP